MKNKLLFYSLFAASVLFISYTSQAQYYMAMGLQPGNPGAACKDSDIYFKTGAPPAGSTTIITETSAKKYTLQYSAIQTIPFTFNFNGSPVTQYKASSSGYVTFTTASATPTGLPNAALPSAAIPDNSICVWGGAGAAGGGDVYTKVYGTSPNRQLWIVFWFMGNPSDTNSQNIWSVVLEETTNNIYIVDQEGQIGNAAGVYNGIPLSVGVQINSTTAFQVPGSPKVYSKTWNNSIADNIYYEFSPNAANAYTPQAKMPLFEEFMQASCDPCYQAAPNLDSVLTNNGNYCNIVRYHVNWPGTDYMNQETQAPLVNARQALYYGVSGVPDERLDGQSSIYNGAAIVPSDVRSFEIQDEMATGSPFGISMTAQFDPATDTYSASAVITAYHTMPAGLIAQAMLEVDTVKYKNDQSTEDPGNNSPYLLDFPQVAEEMMPGSNGTSMPAFTSVGQTYTLNVSWKKNHPWGINRPTYPYDSTNCHILVFVQSNTATKYVYQSASAPTTIVLGINELNSVSYFNLYPNPTNGEANIAFTLKEDKEVNIEVYNMLGEKVYNVEQGTMIAGDHLITINNKGLRAGIYFVRFITNDGIITRKLIME
jgi:hypothetical protein